MGPTSYGCLKIKQINLRKILEKWLVSCNHSIMWTINSVIKKNHISVPFEIINIQIILFTIRKQWFSKIIKAKYCYQKRQNKSILKNKNHLIFFPNKYTALHIYLEESWHPVVNHTHSNQLMHQWKQYMTETTKNLPPFVLTWIALLKFVVQACGQLITN